MSSWTNRSYCPTRECIEGLLKAGNISELAKYMKRSSLSSDVQLAIDDMIENGYKPENYRWKFMWMLTCGFHYLRHSNEGLQLRSQQYINDAFWSTEGLSKFQSMSDAITKFVVHGIKVTGKSPLHDLISLDGDNRAHTDITEPSNIGRLYKSEWTFARREDEMIKRYKEGGEWSAQVLSEWYKRFEDVCTSNAERAVTLLWAAQWLVEDMRQNPERRTLVNMKLVFDYADQCMQVAYGKLINSMKCYCARGCYFVCKEAATLCSGTEDEYNVYMSYWNTWKEQAKYCIIRLMPNIRVSEVKKFEEIIIGLELSFMIRLYCLKLDKKPIPHFQPSEISSWAYDCFIRSPNVLPDAESDMLKIIALKDIVNDDEAVLLSVDGVRLCKPDADLQLHVWSVCKNSMMLTVDKTTFETALRSTDDSLNLIRNDDIAELFVSGLTNMEALGFSLDNPNCRCRINCVHVVRSSPNSISGSRLEKTMLNVDYAMKQLALGLCVSPYVPFNSHVSSVDNLFCQLPEHIRRDLQPIVSCNSNNSEGCTHARMWIEVDKITYDMQETDQFICLVVHDIKMSVYSRPLVPGINGELRDSETENSIGVMRFCEGLTKHYDEISKYWPELMRLKKLAMLDFLIRKVKMQACYDLVLGNLPLLFHFHNIMLAAESMLSEHGKPETLQKMYVPTAFHNSSRSVVCGGITMQPAVEELKRVESFDFSMWPFIKVIDRFTLGDNAEYTDYRRIHDVVNLPRDFFNDQLRIRTLRQMMKKYASLDRAIQRGYFETHFEVPYVDIQLWDGQVILGRLPLSLPNAIYNMPTASTLYGLPGIRRLPITSHFIPAAKSVAPSETTISKSKPDIYSHHKADVNHPTTHCRSKSEHYTPATYCHPKAVLAKPVNYYRYNAVQHQPVSWTGIVGVLCFFFFIFYILGQDTISQLPHKTNY